MITVIGLGFVGLTTGLGFAKKGFKTYGIDIDKERVNTLRNLRIPFHEPHLKEVLEETINNTFFINSSFDEAIKNSKAIFICVGTPSAKDGSADLTYLFKAIEDIINVESDNFKVIITKSTVPPSTVFNKVYPFVVKKSNELKRNIGLASNPEFLREGYCWEDFIEPDRIVIGIEDEESKAILSEVYKPFDAPIHYVTYNTAEFIKYLSNTLLSTMISYSNEMSMVANYIGNIDIPKAFRILHEDKRWSGNPANMASYVYPGCGYGGYCLPKDTSALYSISKENGYEPQILGANLKVNEQIQDFVANKVSKTLNINESIGILGLSFKPESDDVRITPTKKIISKLFEKGFTKLNAYDPISNEEFKNNYPELKLNYLNTLEELLELSDNILILTGWKEFKEKKDVIQQKRVFDFRYIF